MERAGAAAAVVMAASLAAMPVGPAVAGTASDLINNLTTAQRVVAFRSVIEATGATCGAITRTIYRGDNSSDHGAAYYAVHCEPGGDWNIAVQNTGNMTSRVVSCDAEKLDAKTCWDPF
jgi:hypothetical protein